MSPHLSVADFAVISSKTKSIFFILSESSFHAGFSPSEFFFAIHMAPNGSISMLLPHCFSRFFHMLVLKEAIIEASGSALADLTIPECLDDSAAHNTALSRRQTFPPLPLSFSFLCSEMAVAAPKHPPPITTV